MRPFSTEQLRTLIQGYCDATGSTPEALSYRIFHESKNRKALRRILDGLGCSLGTAERASAWLSENWPDDLPWPTDVPAPQGEAA